jgi:alpha-amylase
LNASTIELKNKKAMFKKADWIFNTDVYEVNLRQYSTEGTINAFKKELPRLKDMGVSTLWFMPLTPISEKNRKGSLGSQYACSDYTSVSAEYGTLEDFKMFVSTAHEMGFKVIIDWVANHTGWDHVWTIEHPDYYKMDEATNDFKKASGMDDIIELDYNNTSMRKAMIDAMQFWVDECDIDGFRCDLAFWVQLDFWVEARTALEKIKVLFWLAESDPVEHPLYFQAFDACYTWQWMHKTAEFYKGSQDKKMLDEVLQQYNHMAGNDNLFLWFTSNHDENTWNGTEFEKYGDAADLLAVFSCTWNGIPLIYSGQELPNHKRLLFFDKDVIEWTGEYARAPFYKTLLTLHKNNPALRAGDRAVSTHLLQTNAAHAVMAYLRSNGDNEVLTILNFSKHTVDLVINDDHVKGVFKNVFTGTHLPMELSNGFSLKPWDYLVFEKVDKNLRTV